MFVDVRWVVMGEDGRWDWTVVVGEVSRLQDECINVRERLAAAHTGGGGGSAAGDEAPVVLEKRETLRRGMLSIGVSASADCAVIAGFQWAFSGTTIRDCCLHGDIAGNLERYPEIASKEHIYN